MKRTVFAGTLALAILGMASANAADVYAGGDGGYKDGPMEPIWSWSGFYVGINGGYAFSDEDNGPDITVLNPGLVNNPTLLGSPGDLEVEGGFGGGQVGYNMQFGGWVFGIEADIQAGDISDDSTGDFNEPNAFSGRSNTEVNYFGTVRGRLGYAFDRTLVYVTGGYAYADVDVFLQGQNAGGNPAGNIVTFDEQELRSGYAVGGGFEHALTTNITFKIEYQYLEFDDETYGAQSFQVSGAPSGVFYETDSELALHTIRAGLNYKF